MKYSWLSCSPHEFQCAPVSFWAMWWSASAKSTILWPPGEQAVCHIPGPRYSLPVVERGAWYFPCVLFNHNVILLTGFTTGCRGDLLGVQENNYRKLCPKQQHLDVPWQFRNSICAKPLFFVSHSLILNVVLMSVRKKFRMTTVTYCIITTSYITTWHAYNGQPSLYRSWWE